MIPRLIWFPLAARKAVLLPEELRSFWMDEEGFDPDKLSKLDAVRCFLYDRKRPENHSGVW